MKFIKNLKEKSDKNKVVDTIQTMYRKSYDAKSKLYETWDKCYKAYTGDLFKDSNAPSYRSQEISNFIFSTIETVKPVMLANKPKLIALPHQQEDFEKAESIQRALDYEWDRTNMFSKMGESLTNGLIYGTFILGMFWDGKSQKGLGNVEPKVISPFNFFIDPMATSIDEAQYVMYATYKNVGDVIKAYPDKREELIDSIQQPSDEYLMYGKDNSQSSNSVLYIECYQQDYSLTEEEVDGSEGKEKVKKLKYPNGRRTIIAGDVLLFDGQNPYKDGKFPFKAWRCYQLPGQFWGMGEVEQIISPQKYAGKLTNNILTNAGLMSNAAWILDKNSGVKKDSLTNQEGLVVRKNPGTEVRRDQPPALPSYIRESIDMLKNDIEIISGVFDVTRGERPTGVTAAAAIQALNEQAQGRIKLKLQNFETVIAEVGGLWLSRIQQFWVTQRNVRVMGSDYQVQFDSLSRDDVDGDFDIVIQTGSTMPVNKTARLQQVIQMAQTPAEDGMPLVDRKTVLQFAEIEEIEPILQRFEEIKQQQQMQQQQQAQMQQEQQQAMQQQQMEQSQQEQELAQQELERKHEMELEKMQLKGEQDMDKMALQHKEDAVQSKEDDSKSSEGNEQINNEVLELVEMLKEASPEELQQIVEEYPELQQLIEYIMSGQTE